MTARLSCLSFVLPCSARNSQLCHSRGTRKTREPARKIMADQSHPTHAAHEEVSEICTNKLEHSQFIYNVTRNLIKHFHN